MTQLSPTEIMVIYCLLVNVYGGIEVCDMSHTSEIFRETMKQGKNHFMSQILALLLSGKTVRMALGIERHPCGISPA